MKRLEIFLLPHGRDATPSQVTPPQFVRFPKQFAGTHLYTWVERGTVRVKCPPQEHNTMSPARAQTRTARSGVERAKFTLITVPYLSVYRSFPESVLYRNYFSACQEKQTSTLFPPLKVTKFKKYQFQLKT